jgi:hypothetical protein
MNTQHCRATIALVIFYFMSSLMAEHPHPAHAQIQSTRGASQISRITAGELKSKLSKNEAVTILDVRDTNNYVNQ